MKTLLRSSSPPCVQHRYFGDAVSFSCLSENFRFFTLAKASRLHCCPSIPSPVEMLLKSLRCPRASRTAPRLSPSTPQRTCGELWPSLSFPKLAPRSLSSLASSFTLSLTDHRLLNIKKSSHTFPDRTTPLFLSRQSLEENTFSHVFPPQLRDPPRLIQHRSPPLSSQVPCVELSFGSRFQASSLFSYFSPERPCFIV